MDEEEATGDTRATGRALNAAPPRSAHGAAVGEEEEANVSIVDENKLDAPPPRAMKATAVEGEEEEVNTSLVAETQLNAAPSRGADVPSAAVEPSLEGPTTDEAQKPGADESSLDVVEHVLEVDDSDAQVQHPRKGLNLGNADAEAGQSSVEQELTAALDDALRTKLEKEQELLSISQRLKVVVESAEAVVKSKDEVITSLLKQLSDANELPPPPAFPPKGRADSPKMSIASLAGTSSLGSRPVSRNAASQREIAAGSIVSDRSSMELSGGGSVQASYIEAVGIYSSSPRPASRGRSEKYNRNKVSPKSPAALSSGRASPK